MFILTLKKSAYNFFINFNAYYFFSYIKEVIGEEKNIYHEERKRFLYPHNIFLCAPLYFLS